MKLTEDFNSDKIEIQEEQQQKKEIKLIGQQRKIKGLTLWEYNHKTKELKKAKYQKVDVNLKSLSTKDEDINFNHRVIVNENCLYFQALNESNAIKKLLKRGLTPPLQSK
jgi:hypothetical protein